MPLIVPGCYTPCNDAPCDEDICQLTDINPCICEPEMDCCAACGANEWLCLQPPENCPDTTRKPIVLSAGKSFGMCAGECDFDIVIDNTDSDEECHTVSLSVCDWTELPCREGNIGTLTPTGQAKAVGLAAELIGEKLQETYGCPDCADGGASQVVLSLLDTGEIAISYEYNRPPEVLVRVDTFAQGLIDALYNCEPTDDIAIDGSVCTPYGNE
jgi:hypothetical protein